MLAVLLLPLLFQAAQTTPVRVERLDNGLNVTIATDDALPLVSIQVWIERGWHSPEPPAIAHLPPALAPLVRNERTVFAEHTCIAWTAPRELLDDLLPRAAAFLLDPAPPAARTTIRHRGIGTSLRRALFQDDPPPTTYPADAWAGRLLIIGDVVPAEILPTVQTVTAVAGYREQPPRPTFLSPRPPPPFPTGRRVAFPVAGLGAFEHAADEILLQHLAGPTVTAGDAAPERSITWQRDLWPTAGVLLVSGGDDDFANILRARLTALRDTPLAATELRRAIARAGAANRDRHAGFHERALELGRHEAIGGDLLLAPLAIERLRVVRVAEVRAAAERLLATAFPVPADLAIDPDPPAPPETHEPPPPREWQPAPSLATKTIARDTAPLVICRLPHATCSAVAVASEAPAPLRIDPALADLLDYRGIEVTPAPRGFTLRGDNHDALALLELAHRLIDPAQAPPIRRIALVGAADPEELARDFARLDLAVPAPSVPAGEPRWHLADDALTLGHVDDATWTILSACLPIDTATWHDGRRIALPPDALERLLPALRGRIPAERRPRFAGLATARLRVLLDGPTALAWRLATGAGHDPLDPGDLDAALEILHDRSDEALRIDPPVDAGP